MGGLTIRGVVAEVRWGYQPAFTLRDWTFAGSRREGGSVTATVERREHLAADQRPLAFVWLGNGEQNRWPISEVVETEGRVTLTIAPWGDRS